MPYVDLHSKSDFASIFYCTNTLYSSVSAFDPEKPTIVILHPAFLDSSWLDLQLGDTRLNSNYNLISFDFRASGQSTGRPSGRHDSWVDAADLAFCFQKLHMPPSHIMACEGSAIYCATRFAVLFPEMCLSLTLVNVPAPIELKWIYKNIDELIHGTCFAEDVDSFEQAAFELIEFLFGPRTDPDLIDDLVTFWGTAHPPTDRARTAEMTSVYINRTPLNPEVYALITQPVLILQGEKNELCPIKYAEKLSSQLTGVKDGAILYPVKGGTTMLSVTPDPANTVNATFVNFLSRLPHARSDLVPPEMSSMERMEIALRKLSNITGNPDLETLDPLCSLSFASLSPDIAKAQADLLKRYRKGADMAFDPSLTDGWKVRRYSDRKLQANKEQATSAPMTLSKLDTSDRVSKSSTRSGDSVESPLSKTGLLSTNSLEKHLSKKTPSTPLYRLRA